MVEWLTVLLLGLLSVVSLSAREHATFTAPTPAGQGPASPIPRDFQTVLDAYTNAYVQYFKHKDTASKAVLDQAQTQIQASLQSMKRGIDQNQVFIQTFLNDYQNTNPELDKLHKQAQKLETLGPKTGDDLEVSTQNAAQPLNYAALLTRVVILAGILGVATLFS